MSHYHVVISIPRTSPLYDEVYQQFMETSTVTDKGCVQLPGFPHVPIDNYLFCPEGICLYTTAIGNTSYGEGKLVYHDASYTECDGEIFSFWYERDSELGGGDD